MRPHNDGRTARRNSGYADPGDIIPRSRFLIAGFAALCRLFGPAIADSFPPLLAAFHDRQMAIVEGTAYGWEDDDRPVAHGR